MTVTALAIMMSDRRHLAYELDPIQRRFLLEWHFIYNGKGVDPARFFNFLIGTKSFEHTSSKSLICAPTGSLAVIEPRKKRSKEKSWSL
jgi:hypothetical protein